MRAKSGVVIVIVLADSRSMQHGGTIDDANDAEALEIGPNGEESDMSSCRV